MVVAAAVAAAAAAMSGHWQRRTCAVLVEGHGSNNNALLGLHCSAQLALLGLLHSACIKVKPLMRWLALRACNAGQRWGGAAALAAMTMVTTDNYQLKGAVEEMTAAATVTGSGDDCNNGDNGSGDDGSGDDGSGDDGGCSDGNGNTKSGSGGINGSNCDSDSIVVVMVKTMAAVMVATMVVTAMAGVIDNNQLKGALKKRRRQQREW